MSKFENYFDEHFIDLKPEVTQMDTLIDENKDYLLIAGDFFGIQKFIFERLSSKNAAKVLRAKSAFIQIFTKYLAKFICHRLDIDEKYILSTNAGKFEILSPNTDREILAQIHKLVDDYFIHDFYGLSGVTLCGVECSGNDFSDTETYRTLRDKIASEIELKKFNKLDLANRDDFVLSYDDDINNNNLCDICNIRKKAKNNCDICDGFIRLGELLVKNEESCISSNELGMTIDGFDTEIVLDTKIKSYILKESDDKPADFSKLADNSCYDLDTGIKSLAVLKADVDSMGTYLRDGSDITGSFENFDLFSKTLDNFFSVYIPRIMRDEYPNSYTVFAGGDDLFLLGAWDEMLELARRIQKDFKVFTKGQLTISFGIAIAKPSHPIGQLANFSEKLLEKAKEIDSDKNAITLFNETAKWENYLSVYTNLSDTFMLLKDSENTAFLYRLLELVDMKKRVLKGDIEATIWKSKLRYSWSRNMTKEDSKILEILGSNIEKYPSETKMFLSEYIYKRRIA